MERIGPASFFEERCYSMSGHIKSVVLFLFVSVLISCSGGSEDPPPVVEANCDAMINLNTTDEGGQNIEISWTTQGDYTSFEVEYGADGYTVGTGTSTTSSSNSLNITSLELDTAYDIYIRGICPSETSNWFGPLSAATICDAGSFSGDVTLTTQTEVDAIAGQCFTGITGSLIIDGEDSTEAITDLSGLVELTEITGGLIIKSNQELQNLNGLEGLQSVGFIIIDWNFNNQIAGGVLQ